jgi:hypothetical protein
MEGLLEFWLRRIAREYEAADMEPLILLRLRDVCAQQRENR